MVEDVREARRAEREAQPEENGGGGNP
jgi:hypothetical protein